MKPQHIVKGKHNGKKEKKPVAGHDNKKVKEQHKWQQIQSRRANK